MKIHKALAPAALALAFCQAGPAWQQPEAKPAAVRGRVTNARSGEPVRKAMIRLTEEGSGQARQFVAVSGADGTFAIENVTPGNYRLTAYRPGFSLGAYGATTGVGTQIRLAAGARMESADVKLLQFAVMSGRVLDEDGDPVGDGRVTAYRQMWTKGQQIWQAFDSAEIDDRGEFRISGLRPGRYVVVAAPQSRFGGGDRVTMQTALPLNQPTFYPSVSSREDATIIPLRSGQEMPGVEIRLKRARVYRLQGQVMDPALANGDGEFRAWQGPRVWARSIGGDGQLRAGRIRKGGGFEISGLAPGAYEVGVSEGRAAMATLGKVTVNVRDADVEGVQIPYHPPQALRGQARLEGQGNLEGLQIQLDMMDRPGRLLTEIQKDGAFTFPNVAAERYRLRMAPGGPSSRMYLKTVRWAAAETRTRIVDLSQGAAGPLEVLLSGSMSALSGAVKASGGGSARGEIQVWLIPESSEPEFREYGAVAGRLEQTGGYSVASAEPGEYRVFAWENLPEALWRHPGFFDEMASKGTRVTLKESEAKQLDVPLIAAADVDAAMAKLGLDREQ